MSILNFFRQKPKNTAAIAKERLQVVIAHERSQRTEPDFLPKMKQELLAVIRKYVEIDDKDISVNIENQESCEILEFNVTLPSKGH